MTKIKLCGLGTIEAIEEVNRLMPDYAGFICSAGFRRSVDEEKLRTLKSALDPRITAVGVFVNEPMDRIVSLLDQGLIDAVQLHGHETDSEIDALKQRRNCMVLKAVKIDSPEAVKRAEQSHSDLVVADGGTGEGKTFDWSLLKSLKRPFLLAGGLTPENVREAIGQIHPYGVDTSSGIETGGIKDPVKMRRFVERIREMKYDE